MATNNSVNANSTTPLPIVDGGTQVTSVTTAPTATAFAGWDGNKNLSANNAIEGYATTVTSATPLVLVVGSAYQQYLTGSTAQTVTLPVTSTLASVVSGTAQSYLIVNNSSATTTVNSSGGNLVESLPAGSQAIFTCISNSGTTAASWSSNFVLNVAGVASITGTANEVIASSATGAVTLSLPQAIATTSDVTFDSMTFSTTTKGIVGTTTNNSAASGYVGEVISASRNSGSPLSLSTATPANVTSISLTAGDWDVYGNVYLTNSGTASSFSGAINTTSATLPDASLQAALSSATFSITGSFAPVVPTQRLSLSGTTTVYLVAQASFNTGSVTAQGTIYGRRSR